MNITVKFRGFSSDLNKWIYGSLHKPFDDVAQIIERTLRNVSQMTLVVNGSEGQFIGSFDKNGNEIYSGDIVETGKFYFIANKDDGFEVGSKVFCDYSPREDLKKEKLVVEYRVGLCGYFPFSEPSMGGYEYDTYNPNHCIVIGNRYEHLHLLSE